MKRRIRKQIIGGIITFFVVMWALPSQAQRRPGLDDRKFRIGFVYGHGYKGALKIRYDYRVTFYQLQTYHGLVQRPGWGLELVLQPQYNPTIFKYDINVSEEERGFEFGLNAGLILRKNFWRDMVSVYILPSIGPHFISGAPKRQSSGFIFSDNFFVGLQLRLFRQLYLDIRPGIRHISNAGLLERNGGINNLIMSGGLMLGVR